MTALIDMVQARLGAGGKQGIKWITASVGNAVKMFSIDEVLFFQAQDKYTRVVTSESEGHIRTPLKDLRRRSIQRLSGRCIAASSCASARFARSRKARTASCS